MYTNHFYKRMGERVYANNKRPNNKEQKIQRNHSKTLVKKALKNNVAEYKDTYGFKYIYSYIDDNCFKYIFKGQKVITVYKVDINEEKEKYDLKFNNYQGGFLWKA